jgi:uncharacterized protein (TIGR02145 family)
MGWWATAGKSQTGWNSSGNGTDAFGFAALPVGKRSENGYFYGEGDEACFWRTEDVNDGAYAYSFCLEHDAENVTYTNCNKGCALSVRCLRD